MIDFLAVDEEVVQRASKCVEEVGNIKLKLVIKLSSNPDDSHLYIVLAERQNEVYKNCPYIVWLYNDCEKMRGLHEGRYDLSMKNALEAMSNKM